MDFKLSPEQERFRADLRGWLEANSPGDWGKIRAGLKTREAQAEFLIGWQRKIHGAGYVGLHWPTAYGGRGATVLEQAIFYEEMARERAVGDGWWQYRALRSRGDTIAGGISEIMKNILAERVLGLPKG